MQEQHHEMILEKTHSSGEEEWYCPACGRRMLINWHPQFKKTILEAGDNYAMHNATKGLMPIEPLKATSVDSDNSQVEAETLIDDSRLSPWLAWLEEVDFDKLWDSKD